VEFAAEKYNKRVRKARPVKPLEQEKKFVKNNFMVQFSNSIEKAVANSCEAMESGYHFKNGASSKSHTSRVNIL